MSISDNFVDAMNILTTQAVKQAGYDKTIQAQILSCEDATIGKYRCKYQDSIFYAYANSADVNYTNGSYVYILIPGNDFNKDKTILGSTEKLGVNYISQAEGDQAYDLIGTNCIQSEDIFYLDTNNINYSYRIYDVNNSQTWTGLNLEALNQYIKRSSSLIAGATFQTSIPVARQYRGHYGITYGLEFYNNNSTEEEQKTTLRTFTLNEDGMTGQPYRLNYPIRQYKIFDIDGSNFKRVNYIEIFNSDFPNATGNVTTGRLNSGDITISKLEMTGAVRMSDAETNGIAITFYTPQGTFFTENALVNEQKQIIAQVRVKGKLVSEAQNIPFYWGKENVSITPKSEYYNTMLGRGWKCLNQHNVVLEGDESTNPVVEWVPGKNTYIMSLSEATAKDNRLKVAIVYDETVITKEINIQNLGDVPQITIESDSGTKFYYDIGNPTLTCKINGKDQQSGSNPLNYTYYWAYESNEGVLQDLEETTLENAQYNQAVQAKKLLLQRIEMGLDYPNAKKTELDNLEITINNLEHTQRVEKNKVCGVQVSNITNFGKFKCSVYNTQGTYLGTSAITLTNSYEGEDLYSLIINNGSATFQYNENGIAPNNGSLDNPQTIQGLSFSMYDNLGNEIDVNDIIGAEDCKVRWSYPIADTLLVHQEENGQIAGTDPLRRYEYYDNAANIIYNISQHYNINKKNNQIKLEIDYKGMHLATETSFTFVKQGEPGTNGTEFIVKLIPNVASTVTPPQYPMITQKGSKYYLNYGIGTSATEQEIFTGSSHEYKFFKAQLWHNGQKVWEGLNASASAYDGITKPTLVHWEVLKNTYSNWNGGEYDASDFGMGLDSDAAAEGKFYYVENKLYNKASTYLSGSNQKFPPVADIVKCTIVWEGKQYYGTIPIITAWTANANYKVSLRDGTGFRYVLYSSDGMSPQYDRSHPFEFVCEKFINGYWEDISTIENSEKITYTFTGTSSVKRSILASSVSSREYTESYLNLLELLPDFWNDNNLDNQPNAESDQVSQLPANQVNYRPASRYDGECVNVSAVCIYQQGNSIVGVLNVPIHFLLNKYGLSHINEWDGNSVQINEEEGYILSPQMGAGKKNNANQFTGVLMGEVRNPSKAKANQDGSISVHSDIGLLGYAEGDRTFFLNSENGSAIFGKSSGGQLIVDPSTTSALLYSSNFWESYDEDTGLPLKTQDPVTGQRKYVYRDNRYRPSGNGAGEGMLINLTEPQIYFGNGKFYVTDEGKLHATQANISGRIFATSLELADDVYIRKEQIAGLSTTLDDIAVEIKKQGDVQIIAWSGTACPSDNWQSAETGQQDREDHLGDYWLFTGNAAITTTYESSSIEPSQTYIYRKESLITYNEQDEQITVTVYKWVPIDMDKTIFDTTDGKTTIYCADQFYQIEDPASSWSGSTRTEHLGDYWTYTGETEKTTFYGEIIEPNKTYKYSLLNGNSYRWVEETSLNAGDYLIGKTAARNYQWYATEGRWVSVLDYQALVNDNLGFFIKKDATIGEEVDPWKVDQEYKANDLVMFEGNIYRSKTTHRSTQTNGPTKSSINWELKSSDDNFSFKVSSKGLLKAHNAVISGTTYSSRGFVGGLNIENNSLYYDADKTREGNWDSNNKLYYYGNTVFYHNSEWRCRQQHYSSSSRVPGTTGGQSFWELISGSGNLKSVYLTPRGSHSYIRTVQKNNWALTLGGSFGVTTSGDLYANSGRIGNIEILNQADQGDAFFGQIGYAKGLKKLDGTTETTEGAMFGTYNSNYLIVTDSGVRMTSGSSTAATLAPSVSVFTDSRTSFSGAAMMSYGSQSVLSVGYKDISMSVNRGSEYITMSNSSIMIGHGKYTSGGNTNYGRYIQLNSDGITFYDGSDEKTDANKMIFKKGYSNGKDIGQLDVQRINILDSLWVNGKTATHSQQVLTGLGSLGVSPSVSVSGTRKPLYYSVNGSWYQVAYKGDDGNYYNYNALDSVDVTVTASLTGRVGATTINYWGP